jgi:tetratricopeptide (TPR) repeat protein
MVRGERQARREIQLLHLACPGNRRSLPTTTQIRTPRESWRGLDDIQPQLVEFQLRCTTGDYDTAASLLAEIDFYYMQKWATTVPWSSYTVTSMAGSATPHQRQPSEPAGDLPLQLEQLPAGHRPADPSAHYLPGHRRPRGGEAVALTNKGNCHWSLGNYQQAIDLHTQALTIHRDTGERLWEAFVLAYLGRCHASLGGYRQAIELQAQALTIARHTKQSLASNARSKPAAR